MSLARSRPTAALPAALCLVVCLAGLPPPAVAQDAREEPSARELRQTYPLDSESLRGGEPAASASAAPASEPTASSRAPAAPPRGAADGGTGETTIALLVLALAAVAGGGLVLLARPTRRRPQPRRGARPLLGRIASVLRPPQAAALSAGPVVMRATGHRGPREAAPAGRLWKTDGAAAGRPPTPPRPPEPAPPATDRAWTAEIEWSQGEGAPRFCVVARTAGQEAGAPIARSRALEWPPTSPAAVTALRQAAEQLEAALLAAGWTPLPPGEAWYAKRFAWQPAALRRPAAAAPAATPVEGRRPAGLADAGPLTRRWPKGTEALWRCEIKWDAGYARSRFKAVAHRPGQRRGHDMGASVPFKWMLMDAPDPTDPKYQVELRKLVGALEAAGWQRVGRGTAWYSERFVWRGEGEPAGRAGEDPQQRREST